MAERSVSDVAKAPELSVVERAYVKRALDVLKGTLIRSRSKEMVGSDIFALRTKEIDTISGIMEKFV